jgi:N4-gp56 family major capsid protein
MAWADLAETSQNTTSTLAAGIQSYVDQTFLEQAVPNLHMMQFADKHPLPKNKGKTMTMFRFNPLGLVTTKLTEGTNPAAVAVDDHTVTRTMEEWGAWTQYSSLVSLTHIDKGLTEEAKLFGTQAGKSIDLRIMKEVVTCGSHMLSADTDATTSVCGTGMRPGQWKIIENGTTASTASIVYCNTIANSGNMVFDDTNDWFIGGQLTGVNGQNIGQSRYIYDSVAAAFSVYVYPSFDFAPADGDEFIFSHPGKTASDAVTAHVLAATDTLTHKVFATAREDLQTYSAPEFDGGYYLMLIGPTTNKGFMVDTAGGWMGMAQYRGESLFRGEIGKYMGYRVIQTSQPFRASLPAAATTTGVGATSATDYSLCGANYSAAGAGHWSLAIGAHAYGMTLFPGMNTPKMIYNPLGSAGAADPLQMQGTLGWKLPGVPIAKNALWCVSIVSGG